MSECVRLRDPPGGSIRDACVEYLAGSNQIVESSHDLVDGRDLIPDMDPIQVDVVGLQPFETRLHGLHHTLALVARGVRVCAWKSVGVFRSEHDALAMPFHKIAEKRFAGPIRVDIGSVDEIAAGV